MMTASATISVENETETRANNQHNVDEMIENTDEAPVITIEEPELQEPSSQENQQEPLNVRYVDQSQEGPTSQDEPSSTIKTNGEVQTIPVPVVQVNQQVVDGDDTRDIKGKILESQDPVICDTDNNVLV